MRAVEMASDIANLAIVCIYLFCLLSGTLRAVADEDSYARISAGKRWLGVILFTRVYVFEPAFFGISGLWAAF